MCIACELGYTAMLDALEAERAASKGQDASARDTVFVCETISEKPGPQPTDESAP
jgi:hypothetical protein